MAKVKRTNSEWQALIDECEASGQTQETWCMRNGINLYTYRDRARRLRRLEVKLTKLPKPNQYAKGIPPNPHFSAFAGSTIFVLKSCSLRMTYGLLLS